MLRKLFILAALLFLLVSPLSAQEEDQSGITPSQSAQTFFATLEQMNIKKFSLDDFTALMKVLERFSDFGDQMPEEIAREPVDVGGVPGTWFSPVDADPDRVILYYHGGGYVTGSVDGYRVFLGQLAQVCGIRVLGIDYRLAPEHPYPAAVEDAATAYRWLLANGFAPEHVAIAGDSAGGGLTLATLLMLRDAGDPLPAVAVVISPWTDLAGTGSTLTTLADADPILKWEGGLEVMAAQYAGEHDPHEPLISPLYADIHNLPPLLILVGTEEILLSDSTRLAWRARRAGVDVTLEVWEGMVHVWPLFGSALPESMQAFDRMAAFIGVHLQ